MLTSPASFTEQQRLEMQSAAEEAGFTDIRMGCELQALCDRWLKEDDAVSAVDSALFVNWDAGRMECRLVQLQPNGWVMDPRVGCRLLSVGFDSLDDRLARYVLEKLSYVKNVNNMSWPELLMRVRELRLRLSAGREDEILSIAIGRQTVNVGISYAEFKTMADVDIVRVSSALRAVYKRIPDEVKPKVIMLAGEAVNMPGVVKSIAASLGLPVLFRHKREDVALTAAELLLKNCADEINDGDDEFNGEPEDFNIDVELFCAVCDGNVEKVRTLLCHPGAAVNIMTEEGSTLLHMAVLTDTDEITRMLLAAGANPNVVDNMGLSPLWNAVSAERWNCVALLIENGADANATDAEGWTLLHRAAANSHLKELDVLLSIPQVEVNSTTPDNETALYVAAAAGNRRAVEMLLSVQSIDLEIRDSMLNFTALEIAEFNNFADCAELLRAAGAR